MSLDMGPLSCGGSILNDYFLKRNEKCSAKNKDLSAACEFFNSGNEINRNLKKTTTGILKKITSINLQKNPVSGHFAPTGYTRPH